MANRLARERSPYLLQHAYCGELRPQARRLRCWPCSRAYQWQRSTTRQLVLLLGERGPLHRDEVTDLLGLGGDLLRSTARRARKRGYLVTVDDDGMYRLEGQP